MIIITIIKSKLLEKASSSSPPIKQALISEFITLEEAFQGWNNLAAKFLITIKKLSHLIDENHFPSNAETNIIFKPQHFFRIF